MKVAKVFALIVVSFCLQVQAGKTPENIPKKIVTGQEVLRRTHQEQFRAVMAELRQMDEEAIDVVLHRALEAELAEIARILPVWCMQIPRSILAYVGFSEDDTDLERSMKFVRLALFVRDMYDDLPINRDTFLTFQTPIDLRIEQHQRYKLVAGCLLQAYQTLAVANEQDSERMLSLADIATWTLHYLEVSGDDSLEGFQVALETLKFADYAIRSTPPTLKGKEHFLKLMDASVQFVARTLSPIMGLALLSFQTQSQKYMW